jgi:hypothetical protein
VWRTHTYRRVNAKGQTYYAFFGNTRYLRMYGFKDPIIEVELIENPEGDYFGLVPSGQADTVKFVMKGRSLFEMQFPYTSAQAERNGEGEVVTLSLREIETSAN